MTQTRVADNVGTLDLGLIGNSQISALIDARGRIVWCCLPRYDGDPCFNALLGGDRPEAGFADVDMDGVVASTRRYRHNSAILETELVDGDGNRLRISDFAPRYKNPGSLFRPMMLVRRVVPLVGRPLVRLRVRPTCGYGRTRPQSRSDGDHIDYLMPGLTLRLTTDAPLDLVGEAKRFPLDRPVTMILGAPETYTNVVAGTALEHERRTDDYWREWCRYLAIPFEWQEAVIRAAITLKLSSFEETGAVIAAHTTSVPEAPDTARTWDYRFCWLRDAYFVVGALNALGVTRTMEGYLNYILGIVSTDSNRYLQPVFGIGGERELDEETVDSLPGYRGFGPVRRGNDAFRQVQNDGYGSVLLSLAHVFFDQRLSRRGDLGLFHLLEGLGEQAYARWNQPDAGLWEFRGRTAVHTYSAAMCWAGLDRLARIARHLGETRRAAHWQRRARQVRAGVLAGATTADGSSLTASFGGSSVDACLLLLPQIGLLPARDPLFKSTLARIERELRRGDFLLRYAEEDDFGLPSTAFLVCAFWYVNALADVGRRREARELFERLLARRNELGQLSEDIDPVSGEHWGNFPQTYSMVGLIRSAMRLSRRWEDAF